MAINVHVITPDQLIIDAASAAYLPADIRNYYTKSQVEALDEATLANANSHSDTNDNIAAGIYNTHIKNVTFNEKTGVFTFIKENGTQFTINTALEKVATNWSYNSTKQCLTLTLADGSTQDISLSDFITETEFNDSDQIDFTVNNHIVTATIKTGSVTESMLNSALIKNIQDKSNAATTSAVNASNSANEAEGWATKAKVSSDNAATSETNTKTSETNAATSATRASSSETNAATSATNAALSASQAATSKNAASTAESNAKKSANAAESSATDASTYAASATKSASDAKKSADAASQSATNAKTSETNAATSATNAKTSETNAKTSETNAKNSADAAAAVAVKTPYIGTNKNWYIWDNTIKAFKDSGYTSQAIKKIELIGGTHTAGGLDTYRITYNNDSTFDYQVYNGSDASAIREFNTKAEFPTTGSIGLIYIDLSTGLSYRWDGTKYVDFARNGTVTSVTLKANSPISIDSAAAITESGTRTISHAVSGATAGSYGDSSNQIPAYGGTFKVPYVTVNATGHVTGISEHTVKIPASDNTTYSLSVSGNNIVLNPSAGTANTITVPYASNAGKVNNFTVGTSVPANAKFTDTIIKITYEEDNHTLVFTQE